jgi:hypothetical protein
MVHKLDGQGVRLTFDDIIYIYIYEMKVSGTTSARVIERVTRLWSTSTVVFRTRCLYEKYR